MNLSRGHKKRILVTGGSGFIGQFLIKKLERTPCEVFNIDLNSEIESDRIDINDSVALIKHLKQTAPDIIIHLAAVADIDDKNPLLWKSNVEGTRNLINAAPISTKRILFASTQLVVEMGKDPNDDQFFSPYTFYGETKAEMERLIRKECKIPWVIFRPTNVWGPNHPSFADAIWKYIDKGYYLHPKSKEPIIRSYGYVENIADQIACLAKAKSNLVTGKVFYLSDKPIDSLIWVNAFSLALRNKSVKTAPLWFLKLLSLSGDCLILLSIKAPFDKGRFARITTSYPVPVESTYSVCGGSKISLDEGVKKSVEWLNSRK